MKLLYNTGRVREGKSGFKFHFFIQAFFWDTMTFEYTFNKKELQNFQDDQKRREDWLDYKISKKTSSLGMVPFHRSP